MLLNGGVSLLSGIAQLVSGDVCLRTFAHELVNFDLLHCDSKRSLFHVDRKAGVSFSKSDEN